MNLPIARRWPTTKSTIGQLYVDNIAECHTLEDRLRRDPIPGTPANEGKIPGATAIPDGRYRIIMRQSPKFGYVPELLNVPGYTDVLIHAGNSDKDTAGCILVGRRDPATPDWVSGSRAALDALIPKILEGLRAGEVWCEIETFCAIPAA